MATFPTLTPSTSQVAPGGWPVSAISSLKGTETRIRQGSAEIGRRLQLTFANVSESDFLAILNHYRGQRSGFDPFGFNTATLASDLTPAGYAWLYTSRPQVVDEHANVFTVSCEFKSEPRGLVVAPGKAWRSGATTLTPGARAGGAAWVTGSTTLTTGTRNSGVGSNGVAWETGATTFNAGPLADPSFSSVSLLLPFTGSNNSTTFTDSSSNALATSSIVNAKISTVQSKFGGSAGLFADSNSYITYTPQSLLQLTANFTIEAQIYPLSSADMITASSSSDSNTQIFRLNEVGSGSLSFYLNGTQVFSGTAAGITVNTWQHVAICRSGSSTRMFVNGLQIGSTNTSWTGSFRIDVIGAFFVGGSFNGGCNVYFDDFRVTQGARYTANFTPPASPFPNY